MVGVDIVHYMMRVLMMIEMMRGRYGLMMMMMMRMARIVRVGHAYAVGRFRVGDESCRRVVDQIGVVLVGMMVGVISADGHGGTRDEQFFVLASHQIVHAHQFVVARLVEAAMMRVVAVAFDASGAAATTTAMHAPANEPAHDAKEHEQADEDREEQDECGRVVGRVG